MSPDSSKLASIARARDAMSPRTGPQRRRPVLSLFVTPRADTDAQALEL